MRFALIIAFVCLAALARLPAAPPPVAPQDGHRYLFLFDVSSSMARNRENTEKTIVDLVKTGINGEMAAGDGFTLWPYREKVFTEFYPLATWVPPIRDQIARDVGEALKSVKHEGTGLFYVALVEAFKVTKASRAATVFLISDGSEMLQGTEFDLYANTIYRDHALQARKEKRPFVTTLRAVGGRIIGCTVGFGGDPITLPPIPPEEKARLDAEFAAARAAKARPVTPSSLAVTATKATAPPPPKTPAATKPATMPAPGVTKTPSPAAPPPVSPPAQRPPAVPLSAPAASTPPPPSVKPTTPAPSTTPVATPPLTRPTPAPEPIAAIAVPVAAPPARATDNPPPAAAAPVVASADVPPKPAPPAAQVASAVPSQARFLYLGLGLLVVAGLIVWRMMRRPSGQRRPSLISRSMGR